MENQKQSISNRYEVGDMVGCLQLVKKLDKTRWQVLCTKCGNELELSVSTLSNYRKANIDHCRYCEKIPISKKYSKGQILGNCFRLIEFLGGNQWLVECTKCGREQTQSIANMKKHKTDICYFCTHPTAIRNPKESGGRKGTNLLPINERIYNYYSSRILNSNKKYKEWSLSLDDFTNLIYKKCHYCGSEPTENNMWNKGAKRVSSEEIVKINGIDRVDSSKGYTIDNCVPCCYKCNRMKSDMDVNEFIEHVHKIAKWNECLTTIENKLNKSE